MSKLACMCGHIMIDQTDELPYKAAFISDLDTFSFYDDIDECVASYKNAQDLSHNMVSTWIKYAKDMYECEQCGRLWIQTQGNQFKSFQSESGKYEAVLNVKYGI